MGLEIAVYKKTKKFIGRIDIDADCDGQETPISATGDELWNTTKLYINDDFADHAGTLENGWYEFEDVESPDFNINYSAYSDWRQELADMAGFTGKKADPFYYIIWFSDCQGVIGPEASAKLAQDFEAFDQIASKKSPTFYRRYRTFADAFAYATDGGFVKFI
ncbi:hypothetical protein E0J20_09430 [Rhizobium leguminosarum bv. viciae]|nr:hypothetical protein E0J20_09430 [Rhizobium leguminosarum bv. viciae]